MKILESILVLVFWIWVGVGAFKVPMARTEATHPISSAISRLASLKEELFSPRPNIKATHLWQRSEPAVALHAPHSESQLSIQPNSKRVGDFRHRGCLSVAYQLCECPILRPYSLRLSEETFNTDLRHGLFVDVGAQHSLRW